jgi:hypothetical protein
LTQNCPDLSPAGQSRDAGGLAAMVAIALNSRDKFAESLPFVITSVV